MLRIILDTNILISAFFWSGYPRKVYNLAKDHKVIILSSYNIEAEFIRVLSYQKFGLNAAEILPLIFNLRRHSTLIEVKSHIDIIKEDPTDNIFLECAVEGNANYIISGDHHLLDLKSYNEIQIMRAKDFLLKKRFIKIT